MSNSYTREEVEKYEKLLVKLEAVMSDPALGAIRDRDERRQKRKTCIEEILAEMSGDEKEKCYQYLVLDRESMINSLLAELIQEVMPRENREDGVEQRSSFAEFL